MEKERESVCVCRCLSVRPVGSPSVGRAAAAAAADAGALWMSGYFKALVMLIFYLGVQGDVTWLKPNLSVSSLRYSIGFDM